MATSVPSHRVAPDFGMIPVQSVSTGRQDQEDLVALKVTKTPEFFVNGKPLPQFGPGQLKALVKSETRLAYGQ